MANFQFIKIGREVVNRVIKRDTNFEDLKRGRKVVNGCGVCH